MHKVWAVIRREFLERVRTKQFLIGTLLGPVFLAVLVLLPALLMRNTSEKRVVVLDAVGGEFGARVEGALRVATRNERPDGDPRYLVERVVAGNRVDAVRDSLLARTGRNDLGDAAIDGVVLVDSLVLERDTIQYFGANVGSLEDMGALRRTLRQAVLVERLTRAGIDPVVMMASIQPVEMATERVSEGRVTGQSGEASFAVAYAMSIILYLALILYGVQVMTSTVEEKSNRINEVLISSLRPFELMLGKVIGVGSVGLTQMGTWIGTAYLLGSQRERLGGWLGVSPEAIQAMPLPELQGDLLVVFLLFFVLGFFFYAAAYAAVGSTCSTVQETQQASLPVTLFIVVGLMLMFRLLDDPNGGLARTLSLVPPFAPFVTPVRYSLSPVPLPSLLASFAAMVAGVGVMAWVAGRIYRVGILMYGKRASFAEMFRWVRAG